jgi:hypothetical protein
LRVAVEDDQVGFIGTAAVSVVGGLKQALLNGRSPGLGAKF